MVFCCCGLSASRFKVLWVHRWHCGFEQAVIRVPPSYFLSQTGTRPFSCDPWHQQVISRIPVVHHWTISSFTVIPRDGCPRKPQQLKLQEVVAIISSHLHVWWCSCRREALWFLKATFFSHCSCLCDTTFFNIFFHQIRRSNLRSLIGTGKPWNNATNWDVAANGFYREGICGHSGYATLIQCFARQDLRLQGSPNTLKAVFSFKSV